ncbi:tautomerase [Ktedonobacter sp. SOSP1-85]|uniref:tautomerase family protein n=1 Tax=Ktedonobacter sp. SOSP1-85 TaxID=2778367 RepID=UPI0019157BD9|nr:tautomerase family protein [Ktedonobacter sp. SOSP1-85]GHO76551.1 tautomerase [Ktedonobacter sp. SOSP1-85]
MVQIKIYSLKDHLAPLKEQFSDVLHACAVEALHLPPEKRFHRFFLLDPSDFVFPKDRSSRYTILEISLFEGRSIETKKQFIRLLFARLHEELLIPPQDLEITIFETPSHNWGIRGLSGDELHLNYRVEI